MKTRHRYIEPLETRIALANAMFFHAFGEMPCVWSSAFRRSLVRVFRRRGDRLKSELRICGLLASAKRPSSGIDTRQTDFLCPSNTRTRTSFSVAGGKPCVGWLCLAGVDCLLGAAMPTPLSPRIGSGA